MVIASLGVLTGFVLPVEGWLGMTKNIDDVLETWRQQMSVLFFKGEFSEMELERIRIKQWLLNRVLDELPKECLSCRGKIWKLFNAESD